MNSPAGRERPILFSALMVRSILSGQKTQTRRVVKPQSAVLTDELARSLGVRPPERANQPVIGSPFGQPGDRLWVRETWAPLDQGFDTAEESSFLVYRADAERPEPRRWRPSIHMPRRASRITLEITSVRVERLQDISEADCLAEGITPAAIECDPRDADEAHSSYAIGEYRDLWESIYGHASWRANPWVWVVDFKRVPEIEHAHLRASIQQARPRAVRTHSPTYS